MMCSFFCRHPPIIPLLPANKKKDYNEFTQTNKEVRMPAKKKSSTSKAKKIIKEEYKVEGKKLVGKVKELIHEGNVRRVTIKDKSGKTIVVIPVTVGVVGALLVPPLVVVGAIAALVTECTITVERTK